MLPFDFRSLFLVYLLGCTLADPRQRDHPLVSLHGSGTTNPSRFVAKIMQLMTERARIPLHMTYRAVGSSTGILEFVGVDEEDPLSDFGMGDIPMDSESYVEAKSKGEVMHIPFLVGAISFFYNIPGLREELNMTSCVLSQVFQRNITSWDDKQILQLNPGLAPLLNGSQNIEVVHRVLGSSSTSLCSQYLDQTCPGLWKIGVGSGNADSDAIPIAPPFWPRDTIPAYGSGGVSEAIESTPFSIGYVDSGFGLSKGLSEVAIMNRDGVFLTSSMANLSSAGNDIELPQPTEDWSNVNLLNLPGNNSWPIAAFSYAYVRKNVTEMADSGALLKAFLELMISDEAQGMLEEFQFEPIGQNVRRVAEKAIQSMIIDPSVEEFTFESADVTLPGVGQGLHVISGKRQSYFSFISELNKEALEALQPEIAAAARRGLEREYSEGRQANIYLQDNQMLVNAVIASMSIAMLSMFLAMVALFQDNKKKKTESTCSHTDVPSRTSMGV